MRRLVAVAVAVAVADDADPDDQRTARIAIAVAIARSFARLDEDARRRSRGVMGEMVASGLRA